MMAKIQILIGGLSSNNLCLKNELGIDRKEWQSKTSEIKYWRKGKIAEC
jgi:hypothetical protein